MTRTVLGRRPQPEEKRGYDVQGAPIQRVEHAQHLELGALVGAASRLGLQGGGAVTRHGLQPGPGAAGHPLRGSRYHRSRGVVDIDFGVGTRVSGLRQGKQQMGVAVDQTGHHHLAGGVDDVRAARRGQTFQPPRRPDFLDQTVAQQ